MREKIGSAILSVGVLTVAVGASQPQATSATQAFEVASIHQSKTEAGGGGITTEPGGRFVATGVTLRRLIFSAYNLPMARIVDGPEWVDRIRFDVQAKGDGAATAEQFRAMQQTLLRERFKLLVRREARDMPAYFLTSARNDKRLGPRLRTSAIHCNNPQAKAAAPEFVAGTERPSCGVRTTPVSFRAGGVLLLRLVENLTQNTGRPVIDRTGLTGTFDIELEWDGVGPSIFTALKEQLGLTLEPGRTPIDVLVIAAASLPTDN